MNNVSPQVAKQGLIKNIFYSSGHLALGTAIAFAVNKAAHRLFNIKENSQNSTLVRAISFATGTAVSIYLAPKTPLFPVTGRELAPILATTIGISVFALKFFDDKLSAELTVLMAVLSWGPAVGFAGRFALIPFGALGATIGAVF